MKVLNLFILIGFFILSGCTYVFYGIKDKKFENHQQQLKFLVSRNVDTLDVYSIKCGYLDSLKDSSHAINTYKLKTGASPAAVQIRMYNNSGNFLYGWSQCMGNPHFLKIFDTIPMNSPYELPINFNLQFEKDLDLFEISEHQRREIINRTKNSDYTIIIYWAEWTGKFAKDVFKDVYDYVKSYPDVNIYILKLNTAAYCNPNQN